MFSSEPIRFDDLNIKIRMGDVLINVLYVRYEPGVPNDLNAYHCHSNYELHFIIGGKGEVRFAESRLIVNSGIFYLTGPGTYHEQISGFEDPASELCINFDIKLFKKGKQEHSFTIPDTNKIYHILLNNNFCFGGDVYNSAEFVRHAIRELCEKEIGYYCSMQNMLIQVIINLGRYLSGSKNSSYSIPMKVPEDKRTLLVDEHFAYISADLHTPQVLAKKLGVSTRQLQRILVSDYGMTYSEKLMHGRLEQAKNLLVTTDISVQEIVEKSGFVNVSYFNRVFKKHMGTTPVGYRKKSV